jgi:hypothetical protein
MILRLNGAVSMPRLASVKTGTQLLCQFTDVGFFDDV